MQISTTTAIDRTIPNTRFTLRSVLISDLAIFSGDCIRLRRDNHALNRMRLRADALNFRRGRRKGLVGRAEPIDHVVVTPIWLNGTGCAAAGPRPPRFRDAI